MQDVLDVNRIEQEFTQHVQEAGKNVQKLKNIQLSILLEDGTVHHAYKKNILENIESIMESVRNEKTDTDVNNTKKSHLCSKSKLFTCLVSKNIVSSDVIVTPLHEMQMNRNVFYFITSIRDTHRCCHVCYIQFCENEYVFFHRNNPNSFFHEHCIASVIRNIDNERVVNKYIFCSY